MHKIDLPDLPDDRITMRDWFAATALGSGMARVNMADWELAAIFGKHRTGIEREEIIAADAYRIADAMMAGRTRRRK